MKPSVWKFYFGDGTTYIAEGRYLIARFKAIEFQVGLVGEDSHELDIELVTHRDIDGFWIEWENKGI